MEIQYQLGQHYSYFDEQDFSQKNSTVDFKQAVFWYEKAADQGHFGAMFQLGMCHYIGDGKARNFEKAKNLLGKAEQNGHSGARKQLGLIRGYEEEQKLVERDRKDAEAGNVAAQYRLGMRFRDGNGVPQNWESAYYWFYKAATYNDRMYIGHTWWWEFHSARFQLGICYLEGRGVPKQDLTEAKVWLQRAASNRSRTCRSKRVLRQISQVSCRHMFSENCF